MQTKWSDMLLPYAAYAMVVVRSEARTRKEVSSPHLQCKQPYFFNAHRVYSLTATAEPVNSKMADLITSQVHSTHSITLVPTDKSSKTTEERHGCCATGTTVRFHSFETQETFK